MRIELRRVKKAFGRVEALAGVDAHVPAGRRVALIGPNGSGKSTLIRAVMGLVRCEGEVLLDGASSYEDRERVARRLAYVPQIAPQLSASVAEVVQTVVAVRGVPPSQVAALAKRLDLDLEAVRSRPFRALSGGMKQKLLVALAFAAPATLLILDEPTASLDAAARERFYALFEELPPETTLVLCSHRLEEMRFLVSHVLELGDGRVVYDGSVDDLLGRRGRCVVEVHPEGDAHAGWLREHGFRAGPAGWWARACDQDEKMRVVPEVTQALGGALRNLLVRDLETIDVAGRTDG